MAYWSRLISVARLGCVSSTMLATFGTALTALIAVPAMGTVFDVLLGRDLRAPDYTRTGYASAIVSLAMSVALGVVGKVVADRGLGVFQEIVVRRTFDTAYWIGSSVVPVALSLPALAVTLGGVFLISPSHDVGQLLRVVPLSLAAVLIGALFGMCCAGIGVSLPDPYLAATIAGCVVPITAGIVVPVSLYPDWLAAVCAWFPLHGTIRALDGVVFGRGGAGAGAVGADLLVTVVWAAVGLLFTRVAVRRLRNGSRQTLL